MAAATSKKLKLELSFAAWHRLQEGASSSAYLRMCWECWECGSRQGLQTCSFKLFKGKKLGQTKKMIGPVQHHRFEQSFFWNRLTKLFVAWHNMGTSMAKSLAQTWPNFCLTPKAAEQRAHWWGSMAKLYPTRFEVIVDLLELGGCAKRRRIYILVIARKILRPEIDTNDKLEAVLEQTISQLKVEGPPPNAFLGKLKERKRGNGVESFHSLLLSKLWKSLVPGTSQAAPDVPTWSWDGGTGHGNQEVEEQNWARHWSYPKVPWLANGTTWLYLFGIIFCIYFKNAS